MLNLVRCWFRTWRLLMGRVTQAVVSKDHHMEKGQGLVDMLSGTWTIELIRPGQGIPQLWSPIHEAWRGSQTALVLVCHLKGPPVHSCLRSNRWQFWKEGYITSWEIGKTEISLPTCWWPLLYAVRQHRANRNSLNSFLWLEFSYILITIFFSPNSSHILSTCFV